MVEVRRQKVRVEPLWTVRLNFERKAHAGINYVQIQHAESTYVLVVKREILL